MKITQIHKNTSVPIALRNEDAYTYGFNSYERLDEVSGSGNSYTTLFRQIDLRLGRRKSKT